MSRTSTAEAAAAAREEQDGVPGEFERAGQHGSLRRAVLEQRRLPVASLAALVFLVLPLLPLSLPLRALHAAEVELQLLQVAMLERVSDPERRPQVHLLRRRERGRSGSGDVDDLTGSRSGGGAMTAARRSVRSWDRRLVAGLVACGVDWNWGILWEESSVNGGPSVGPPSPDSGGPGLRVSEHAHRCFFFLLHAHGPFTFFSGPQIAR